LRLRYCQNSWHWSLRRAAFFLLCIAGQHRSSSQSHGFSLRIIRRAQASRSSASLGEPPADRSLHWQRSPNVQGRSCSPARGGDRHDVRPLALSLSGSLTSVVEPRPTSAESALFACGGVAGFAVPPQRRAKTMLDGEMLRAERARFFSATNGGVYFPLAVVVFWPTQGETYALGSRALAAARHRSAYDSSKRAQARQRPSVVASEAIAGPITRASAVLRGDRHGV